MSSSDLNITSHTNEQTVVHAQHQTLTMHHDLPAYMAPVDIDLYLPADVIITGWGNAIKVQTPVSIQTIIDLYLVCGALLDGNMREKCEASINAEQALVDYSDSEL